MAAIGAASGVIYVVKTNTSQCTNTIQFMQATLANSTNQVELQSQKNADLVSQIQTQFLYANFTASANFAYLPEISPTSAAWSNCFDSAWDAADHPQLSAQLPIMEYDMSDPVAFSRYLRSIYCSSVRSGAVVESSQGARMFRPAAPDPASCSNNTNVL